MTLQWYRNGCIIIIIIMYYYVLLYYYYYYYAHQHKDTAVKTEAKQIRNGCNGPFTRWP